MSLLEYVQRQRKANGGLCLNRLISVICTIIFLISRFLGLDTTKYENVTLTFAEDPSGEVITTVFAGPGENVTSSDARSRVVNSGVARISWLDLKYGKHCSLKRIDPVDQAYAEGTLTIDSLTVRQNGIVTISLEGAELKEYFTGNEQVSFTDADAFTFSVTGEDPQLLPTAQLQAL